MISIGKISTRAVWAALLVLSISSALPVSGATLTVINTNDSGAGSLRDAIGSAASGDTINFGVSGVITLTSGWLTTTTDLTISGPGASTLAIDGGGASRVFFIAGVGNTVTISGLTIRNGNDTSVSQGGGILNNPNTLTLT